MTSQESSCWPVYEIVTNRDCNLACSYCFEREKQPRVNNLRDCETFLRASYFRDYSLTGKPRNEAVCLTLIGGETFLYPDLFDGICEIALRLDRYFGVTAPFKVTVSTNGTLLTAPECKNAIERWKDHLTLGFSIDGAKENHDACRVDRAGRGSYDRAVEGLKWAQNQLPPERIYAKATFNHARIHAYAKSVIHLIELGFQRISANTVYEEIWTPEDSEQCAAELRAVADYMLEKRLLGKITFRQLNPSGSDPRRFTPGIRKESNWCGSCKSMCCLGLDGLLYGCHRFATMKDPLPIGHIEADPSLVIDYKDFITAVTYQYREWPLSCQGCQNSGYCASCAVAAYEYDRKCPERFFQEKPQCGWTKAIIKARGYLKDRLLKGDSSNV